MRWMVKVKRGCVPRNTRDRSNEAPAYNVDNVNDVAFGRCTIRVCATEGPRAYSGIPIKDLDLTNNDGRGVVSDPLPDSTLGQVSGEGGLIYK